MLLAVLLTACCPKIYPTQLKEDVVENIVEKEIPRDTVVVIRPDSTILSALVECNARGEADGDGIGDVFNDGAQPTEAEYNQDHACHHGGNGEP